MIFQNLQDGGPSHSGHLLGPSTSMCGGTPGTNPRQALPDLLLYLKTLHQKIHHVHNLLSIILSNYIEMTH
jgi:hypothetical protein